MDKEGPITGSEKPAGLMKTSLTCMVMAGCVVLAACSGGSGNRAVAPLLPAMRTSSSNGHLYIANASTVVAYGVGGSVPVRTISKVAPAALAVDSKGNLYVANVPPGTLGTVDVYAPGKSSPKLVISSGVHYPNALLVDTSRNLYVSNFYNALSVYAPNKKVPSYQIQSLFSAAMALSPAGDLYDAEQPGPYGERGGKVKVYGPGKKVPKLEITNKVDLPAALALDTKQRLYVANDGNVTVYAAYGSKLIRIMSAGLHAPRALAVDGLDDLYVADNVNDTVTVYAPNTGKLVRTIRKGIHQPKAIALGPDGLLYVANAKNVTSYNPTTGALEQTLTKGIKAPVALVFGP